jgi:hypothetical protein
MSLRALFPRLPDYRFADSDGRLAFVPLAAFSVFGPVKAYAADEALRDAVEERQRTVRLMASLAIGLVMPVVVVGFDHRLSIPALATALAISMFAFAIATLVRLWLDWRDVAGRQTVPTPALRSPYLPSELLFRPKASRRMLIVAALFWGALLALFLIPGVGEQASMTPNARIALVCLLAVFLVLSLIQLVATLRRHPASMG